MKTFEITYTKADQSKKRTEWFFKKWHYSMRNLIKDIVKRGDEIEMVVDKIYRIN